MQRNEYEIVDDYEGVPLTSDVTHIDQQSIDDYVIHSWFLMSYMSNVSEFMLIPLRSTIFWFTFALAQRENIIPLDEITLVSERRQQRVALIKGLLMCGLLLLRPSELLGVTILGLMLRLLEHNFRKPANFLVDHNKQSKSLSMTENDPINLLHWNAALGSDYINARNFMPDSKIRVPLIVNYIASVKPDIILLEEIWNEDAAKELVKKLNQHYKYIIFNVGFNTSSGLNWLGTALTGLNSGLLLATNYEIEFRQFSRFKHMLPRDRFPARGALEIAIKLTDTNGVPIFANNNKQREVRLLGVHAQSDNAEGSAEARHKQFSDIHATIEQEKNQNSHVEYILVGDTNCPGELKRIGFEMDESGKPLPHETKNTLFFNENYREFLISEEGQPTLFNSTEYSKHKQGTFFNVGEHPANVSGEGQKIEPAAFATNQFNIDSPRAVIKGIFYDKTLVPKTNESQQSNINGETIIRGDIPIFCADGKKTPVSDHLPVHSKLYFR